MFPYPSGDKLHAGHYYNYAIIRNFSNESIEIKLNDVTIANANHDMDGWHGMRKLEDLVIDIAKLLNIPINEIEECEEDDDE